jgi:hypothetical protein
MNTAAMIERGKQTWQTTRTRMAALPPELRGPFILASLMILAGLIWLALRRRAGRNFPADSWHWRMPSSIGSSAARARPTTPTTPAPATTIEYDEEYMIKDGGEVFWNFAAMYRERNTLYEVNRALNELELRVATMEKKGDGGRTE